LELVHFAGEIILKTKMWKTILKSLLIALAHRQLFVAARLSLVKPADTFSVVKEPNTSPVSFILFDNGASSGGVDVSLTPLEFRSDDGEHDERGAAFAVDMSRRIAVSKYKAPKPVIATKAYREDGERIRSFEQLAPSNDGVDGDPQPRRVYLVADGLEFVWPFISVGHNQTISRKVVQPAAGEDAPAVVLESMSERPRVFRVHGLFTAEDANTLIKNAQSLKGPRGLKPSTVGSGKVNGKDVAHTDPGRTSHNAWDGESPAARSMITRSFELTTIDEDPGKIDGLQIVRYIDGQGYNTHPDFFTPRDDGDFDFKPYTGGSNRFATVFMYLNDVSEGGYTVFPRAPGVIPEREPPQHAKDMFEPNTWQHNVIEQCYKQLAVPAQLGTAALFYSVSPDGRMDPSSHHAACPVTNGTKWGANIWIWNRQRYGDIQTGVERSLEIVNAVTDPHEKIYISWEGHENGIIHPGQTSKMNSFEYHRFNAKFNSYSGKLIESYTVRGNPPTQQWIIRRPKVYSIENFHESREDFLVADDDEGEEF